MFKIVRYKGNPVVSPIPGCEWSARMTMNPGVVFDKGLFRMLFTAGHSDGTMALGYGESKDGFHFDFRPEPFLGPNPDENEFDHASAEDPRITTFEGKHYIAYAARSFNLSRYGRGESRLGPGGNRNPTWARDYRRVGLAVTEDWQSVKRLGPLSSEHMSDANVALLPEKINGKFAYLHRPTPSTPWTLPMFYYPASIWLLLSDRIDYWSTQAREMPWDMTDGIDVPEDYLLAAPEREWEAMKIGPSGVPIPTDDGWLMLYHGVDRPGKYRVGIMLLDREDPRKVLCRTPDPIMESETDIELHGEYPGVVFPTANVPIGDEVFLYYGAGDSHCSVANFSLKEALAHVKKFPRT
jgi:predicted GH43/DUF377 family glycosyl hydrolase